MIIHVDLKTNNLYRDEASKALNRRDDLTDLKRRLSSNRDLLDADHASKPWLKFRSVSQKSLDLEQVKEDSGQGSVIKEFPAVFIQQYRLNKIIEKQEGSKSHSSAPNAT